MMLAETKRGQKVECNRRDQIVILRRTNVRAIMRIRRLQAGAKTFLVIQRLLHITSTVSTRRGQNPAAPPLVDRGIRPPRATGRIDRCVPVSVRGKEIREAYRHRERPLL